MPVTRLTKLLAGILLAVAVAHLTWSSGVAFALERWYPHRVVDLRRWSGSPATEVELLARFIDVETKAASRPVVAFFGSSFTFGYPWQEPVILTRRFSELRPDRKVINASVVGAALSRVHDWELCGARRQQVRFAAAVIEIPVVNTVAALATPPGTSSAAGGESDRRATCGLGPARGGYLPFALKQPLGLGWVRFLWNVEAYEKRDESIVIAKVPKGYFTTGADFARVSVAYRSQISEALTLARELADRVYVFPSPVYLPGLKEIGEDTAALTEQFDATVAACRAVAGVECLDITPFFEMREAYYNLTHLNQLGHSALARWLAARVDADPQRSTQGE